MGQLENLCFPLKLSSVHCEGLLRSLLSQHHFCYRNVEFLQHLLLFLGILTAHRSCDRKSWKESTFGFCSRASRPGMAAGPCTAFPQYLSLVNAFFPLEPRSKFTEIF